MREESSVWKYAFDNELGKYRVVSIIFTSQPLKKSTNYQMIA